MLGGVVLAVLLTAAAVVAEFDRATSTTAPRIASPVAGTPPAVMDADGLRQVVRDRLHALLEADLSDADALYAADFENLTAAGVVQSREEYLGRIRSGEHDYRLLEPASAITVRLYGAGAVVTYQSQVDLVSGGNYITGYGWHTEEYERRDGRWQIVWAQTTQIRD